MGHQSGGGRHSLVRLYQVVTVTILFNKSVSKTDQSVNIKVCPRGLFLLERSPTSATPYSTMQASSRTCVTACPLGFFPSIHFTNKPSFTDLNSGSAKQQAVLRCESCPSQCTTCLGPKPDHCFVCNQTWVQEHQAAFIHGDKEMEKSAGNSDSECRAWQKISTRHLKSAKPRSRSQSVGTAALLVVIIAIFSAVLVFSVYRLHWERSRGTATSSSTGCAVIYNWMPSCLRRKKYSAIRTDERFDRASWTAGDEEQEIFSAGNGIQYRDNISKTSGRDLKTIAEGHSTSSDFDS